MGSGKSDGHFFVPLTSGGGRWSSTAPAWIVKHEGLSVARFSGGSFPTQLQRSAGVLRTSRLGGQYAIDAPMN